MQSALQDLRFGVRSMLGSPGFTFVATAALALGIGANSAIFSFVDAILLRPLSVSHPEELVKINAGDKDRFNEYSSYPDYLDIQNRTKTISGLAAYGNRGASIGIDAAPILISVCVVSPNYFTLMGVKPVLGRTFAAETEEPAAAITGVISHRFWQRRFGGDSAVAGRNVRLNKRACTILGVMPSTFRGANLDETPDLWIPIRVWSQINGDDEQSDRGSRWMELIGRLRRGTTLEQAQSEIGTIGHQLALSYPKTNRDTRVTLIPESQARAPWARIMGTILLVIAGLVLLIACVNLSSLLLARSESRQREISVRLALGARPGRIVRQLLTEGLILALAGGVLALLLALWMRQLIPILAPASLFLPDLDIRFDGRVIAFTAAVSLLSVLGFGLVPALRASRLDLSSALKRLSLTTTGRLRGLTLGNLLVVLQLALSLMLLIGTGLLARSFWNMRSLHPGFRTENRILFWMVPAAAGFNASQTDNFYRTLLQRVQSLPGVSQATLIQRPPLYPTEGGQRFRVKIPGFEQPPEAKPLSIRYTIVWPNYFDAMGTSILRGRTFSGLESAKFQASLLINDAMAREFWPLQDPIGKHVQVLGKDCEVIGVVQDGKYVSLREDPEPYMFLAIPQFPSSDMTLMVSTVNDPRRLQAVIEREIQSLAADIPAPEVSTVEEVWRLSFLPERLAALLVGILSALAAFLAITGLYGLISFSVRRRTQEIGIRMALGARAKTLLAMIIRESLTLILAGTSIGLAAAVILSRFLSSQLYGVAATDAPTYLAVSVVLVGVGLIASYSPARHASRVDPMQALRNE